MRTFALLVLAAAVAGCSSSPEPAAAENCPVCGKPVADGPEVRVVRAGESGPGRRYRCFMCPIMEGDTGDAWELRAVTGLDGKNVLFKVNGSRVESDPPTAVVLSLEVAPGDECLEVHRVFEDAEEFRRYIDGHPAVKARSPEPVKFEDVLAGHRR